MTRGGGLHDHDDGLDMDRMTQRTVPARGAKPPATSGVASVFGMAKPAKRERVVAPAFDPKASDRIHKMPPHPDRWKDRSRTYQGIADAMAEQWGSQQ